MRDYHAKARAQVKIARERQHLKQAANMLKKSGKKTKALRREYDRRKKMLDRRSRKLLKSWPKLRSNYDGAFFDTEQAAGTKQIALARETLSGLKIRKIALPRYEDDGEILNWLLTENLPGHFPFTAGVFPFKRENEDPTRMFAGEGDAFRTNKRFKYLSKDQSAKRLSTAFDSVTLYGCDPHERPDIYGKVGNSGVSIATLDDMKALYDGFDLCDPATSVSMTINGPAPTILAMFLNTAIDQQIERFKKQKKRAPTTNEEEEIKAHVLKNVRGTVQADILKEDQGQNTCLFSIDFALKMMADIQDYFIRHQVRRFYSVSISGYHIAEAGANPISQLAFTLANGFTYVETYLTINGPAPTILAMFLNTAIDQQIERFKKQKKRAPTTNEEEEIKAHVLKNVRGTVQADILKEDQGQNTCLFSIDFALKMMADIQDYFIRHQVRRFYSVSISGYHIAEAGANPISQLAFTLANGFTYVETYLARGMDIDDFAPNLSFFFSFGMDPEYSVMGRVARRIWAIAMREKYGASQRAQKLKFHSQTSGRSLHAQEMSFNDIRTTLQALIAIYGNTNSLHTNAFDEAVTTPTGASVRRAMAIQLIINREWGLAMNENPDQGSFIITELTDLVEEAVLREFERLSDRGGVLGAMERGYQRGKIQDESLFYETKKHDGSLPIIGVNTFLDDRKETENTVPELARSTKKEKQSQLKRLEDFHKRHEATSQDMLDRLTEAATRGENVFDHLMEAVRHCSLGQISEALFEAGGEYRRNI